MVIGVKEERRIGEARFYIKMKEERPSLMWGLGSLNSHKTGLTNSYLISNLTLEDLILHFFIINLTITTYYKSVVSFLLEIFS